MQEHMLFFFGSPGLFTKDKQQHSWIISSLGARWFIFLFFKSAIHHTFYEILAGISIIKACYEGVEHVFFTWIVEKLRFALFFFFFSAVMCSKEWPCSWETPEIYIILHHADFTFLLVSRESTDQSDASCRSITRSLRLFQALKTSKCWHMLAESGCDGGCVDN